MGILSLTLTSNNQEFYIGQNTVTDGLAIVGWSSDGDQHIHLSFMSGHCIDCIGTDHFSQRAYPRILLPDTKTRQCAVGTAMVITNEPIEIPSRFHVKVYKSNGDLQDGTVDIKLILQISN